MFLKSPCKKSPEVSVNHVSSIPSTGEPGRSTSIPVGLQSKARQKISSSNPQLNATLTDDQQGSFSSGKWVDDDEEPRMSDTMNMPGNRNSMAETRPSSLSVPGLVSSGSGSRKVLDLSAASLQTLKYNH